MRSVRLDPDSGADRASFRSLKALEAAFVTLDTGSWLLIGGWMVKAWASQGRSEVEARATKDVDVAVLASRAGRKPQVVEALAALHYRQMDLPFRFETSDGAIIDVLVPPGASRYDPPRIGELETFEAPGTRLAFELPAETFQFQLGEDSVQLPVASLAGALVAKTVLLQKQRRRRVRDDAHDVAALLAAVERMPDTPLRQLTEKAHRSEVKTARKAFFELFKTADAPGTSWVATELGLRAGLEAAGRARWLLDALQRKKDPGG